MFNMQYRKHVDVKDAINPKNPKSVAQNSILPDREYLAYTKLQSLSRRSRYLVNEKDNKLYETNAALTHEIHLGKALRHIDTLIRFLSSKYQFQVSPINIQCAEIKKGELSFSSV
jgi:hypothetical protein